MKKREKITGPKQGNTGGLSEKRRCSYRKSAITAAVLITLVLILGAGATAGILICNQSKDAVLVYEKESYNKPLYKGVLFAEDLCVTSKEVSLDGFQPDSSLHAAGLFDVGQSSVLYGYKMFEKLYPASTTKTLTAYIALKYGNLEETATVSEHAADRNWDESVCGLQTGDQLTLYDLICGLMLQSGNDAATAIAEHISGSEEAFVDLMNKEAAALGATGTHFANPHGLQDEEHYTTAYDLYLIFNEAIKDQRFLDIISMEDYSAEIRQADGTVRTQEWAPTNYYAAGHAVPPAGIEVIGGKTGTTDQAGNCVILFDKDSDGESYISLIMGASDKELLYQEMNDLLEAGIS